MSQYGLWLLPLVIGSAFGIIASFKTGIRWTWGILIQHIAVGLVGVLGFFFQPDWLFAAIGWVLFFIFNFGRRMLTGRISSDLSLLRLAQAHRDAKAISYLVWGPPGRFWDDLVSIVEGHARGDKEKVRRLTEKWQEKGLPDTVSDTLVSYSMLGQMLARDWQGITENYRQARDRYLSEKGKKKNAQFPTQAAIAATRAYLELGRVEEGVEALEAADLPGAMFPRETVLTLLLSAFAVIGAREEVEEILKRLPAKMKSLPNYARTFWRGRCEFSSGNIDSAIELYEAAMKELPQSETGWRERLAYQLEVARSRRESQDSQSPLESRPDHSACVARLKALLDRSLLVGDIVSPRVRGPAVKAIAVILSALYLNQCLAPLLNSELLEEIWTRVFLYGVLDGKLVMAGQIWRLFTYLFLHANLSHVVMNVLGIVWLGTQVERVYGTLRFLVIYILSGISSGLAQALLTPDQPAVGASGAVLGVLGASAAAMVRLKDVLPPRVRRYELSWMITLVLVQLLFDQIVNFAFKLNHSQDAVWIASAAHAGGMASGFVLGYILPLKDKGASPAPVSDK